jgi:hypothetical protein
MNESDVKQMLAAAVAAPAPDRLDIDAAVHSGHRRRRVRVGATLGAALGVVVLAGALVLTGFPGRNASPVAPASPGQVTRPEQIAGRWIAERMNGQDVTGFRDDYGQPVSATFGGTGKPTSWEATGYCLPVSGDFTVTPNGVFHAEAFAYGVRNCPNAPGWTPNQLQAFSSAASARLGAATSTAPETLTLLDRAGTPVAVFHAYDKTATQLCDAALGADAVVSAGPITTAGQVDAQSAGVTAGTAQPAKDLFPGFPYSWPAAYCWTGGNGTYSSYAVLEAGPSVQLTTVSGRTTTPSGPPAAR